MRGSRWYGRAPAACAVLVTGAGRVHRLASLPSVSCARGDEVVGFDNFDRSIRAPSRNGTWRRCARVAALLASSRATSRRADDLARAFAEARPDAVVHLAALAGVRPSLADPARYADVNVIGTVRLHRRVRARRRAALRLRVVVVGLRASTASRRSRSPIRACKPAVALRVDQARGRAAACSRRTICYALDVTCLRFFTVYGPRQRPDLAIHKFARLIAAGKPIALFGDGSTSRDYTWVDDIIDGVVAAIDEQAARARPGFRIYNLGGSRTTTLLRLVELLVGRARQEAGRSNGSPSSRAT